MSSNQPETAAPKMSALSRRKMWLERQHPRLTKYGFATFDPSIDGVTRDKLCRVCGTSVTPGKEHGGACATGNSVLSFAVAARCDSCEEFGAMKEMHEVLYPKESHLRPTRASLARDERIFREIGEFRRVEGTIGSLCDSCSASYCRDCIVKVEFCRNCWKEGKGSMYQGELAKLWEESGKRAEARLRHEHNEEKKVIEEELITERRKLMQNEEDICNLRQRIAQQQQRIDTFERLMSLQAEILDEPLPSDDKIDQLRRRIMAQLPPPPSPQSCCNTLTDEEGLEKRHTGKKTSKKSLHRKKKKSYNNNTNNESGNESYSKGNSNHHHHIGGGYSSGTDTRRYRVHAATYAGNMLTRVKKHGRVMRRKEMREFEKNRPVVTHYDDDDEGKYNNNNNHHHNNVVKVRSIFEDELSLGRNFAEMAITTDEDATTTTNEGEEYNNHYRNRNRNNNNNNNNNYSSNSDKDHRSRNNNEANYRPWRSERKKITSSSSSSSRFVAWEDGGQKQQHHHHQHTTGPAVMRDIWAPLGTDDDEDQEDDNDMFRRSRTSSSSSNRIEYHRNSNNSTNNEEWRKNPQKQRRSESDYTSED